MTEVAVIAENLVRNNERKVRKVEFLKSITVKEIMRLLRKSRA